MGAHTLPERSTSSFEYQQYQHPYHTPPFFRRSNMPHSHSPPPSGTAMSLAGVLPTSANYEELSLIGNGSYGTVYKARDRENPGKIVALKKVRVPLTENGVPLSTLREIALLKQVDQHEHPNIVRLLDVCHGPTYEREQQLVLYLVFEHVDQDMATYIERCPPPGLGGARIKDLMFQLLSGVDFLHSHRIVHRDLKPQNLLVTNSGNVKLADFGLAKTYDFEMRLTSVVVTLWYRSPEVLLGDQYATQVDMWSCGCIMAELFRRTPLFCGHSEVEQLDKIFQVLGTPPKELWPENVSLSWTAFQFREPMRLQDVIPEICPEGKDVLEQMLRFQAKKRISAADALRHPYFANEGYVPMNDPGPIRAPLVSPPNSICHSRASTSASSAASSATSSAASDQSPASSPNSLNFSTSDESGSGSRPGHSVDK